jgi:hypothetical protein
MTGVHQSIQSSITVPTATYIGAVTSPSNLATYTFSTNNISTAANGRIVVLHVTYTGSGVAGSSSSVTIGGVSATLVGGVAPAGSQTSMEMWSAVVPTGTTADFVLVVNNSSASLTVGWHVIYGAKSNTPVAVVSNSGSTSSVAYTLNIGSVPQCIVIAGTSWGNTAASSTWTILTEDRDGQVNSRGHGSAHASPLSGTQSITQTLSSADNWRGCAAAWR